jgi:hypothetical protein
MDTNLLLLDSYNNIEELLTYAFSFSKRLKRKLKIKYVFDFNWMVESYMVGPGGSVDPALVAAEKNAQEQFKVAEHKIRDIVKDLTSKKDSVKYDVEISSINRIDAVQEEYENNPELILLIGNQQSYTEATGGLIGYPNLIEHVKCPVLVIPDQTTNFEARSIMYATDYHPEDVESLTHLFTLLNKDENVKFTVLHNQKEADFEDHTQWTGFKEVVKDETGIKNIEFKLTKKDETLQAIDEFVEHDNPDLIVILKEKKGFFKQLFNSSETKGVLTHLNKPVMVYHEK